MPKLVLFVDVLSSYGCFLGPMIAIMTSDFFIVRKQKLKLIDLYNPSKDSIYWFTAGINWRAYVSWVCGFVPGITGFASVNPALASGVSEPAVKMFDISFIVGYATSFLVHVILNYFFSPKGLKEIDHIDYYHAFTNEESIQFGLDQAEYNIPYDANELREQCSSSLKTTKELYIQDESEGT